MDINHAYDILRVSHETSDEELKRAHYLACSLYHPDKGGDKDTFNKFQLAYKTIVKYRKSGHSFHQTTAPSDFMSLKNRNRGPIPKDKFCFDPEQFRRVASDGQKFDRNKFNQAFKSRESRDARDSRSLQSIDYTYGIDDSGEHERDKSRYEHEQNIITAQAENITPMFGRQCFDNETFQKVFIQHKKQYKESNGELDEYMEPTPLASRGLIECTDVNNPKQSTNIISTGAADFTEAYNMPQNPIQYNNDYLNKIKQNPDITTEKSLSNMEIKNRIRKYHDAADKFKYNTQKLSTDRNTVLLNIGVDGQDSVKANEALREQQLNLYRQEQLKSDKLKNRDESLGDEYSRMLQLRQPIIPPMNLNEPMPRPEVVGCNKNFQHGYTPISPALLQDLQQQTQQPQFHYSPHQQQQQQQHHNTDREMRKLKKKLKQHERTIKKLQKQYGDSNW